MKELFSITVFLVAGLLFSFLSQQEALASPNHASASFSSSSYETFDPHGHILSIPLQLGQV